MELHNHLDGGLRPTTIIDLAEKYNVELPENTPEDIAIWLQRGADRKSLALYLESFGVTLSVIQTTESLERIAYEHLLDLKKKILYTRKFDSLLSCISRKDLIWKQ